METPKDVKEKPPGNKLSKHERPQHLPPFSSPLRKKGHFRQIPGSMESLASDMSMDVSDITMEIEKITKGREDPEVGIKETNRLLKEIDQQMEMSFEIMEDRSHMVRQFLKERESADVRHRKRAEQMMSQFNEKISTMENVLGVQIANPKLNQTSMTQTELIETMNMEIQTSFEEVHDDQDIQQVVKAFTQDMKDVVQKQLLKEKLNILQAIKAQRNDQDQREIDNVIDLIQKQNQQNKVEKIIDDLIKTQSNPDVEKNKIELVAWLIDDGCKENVVSALPEDVRKNLEKQKVCLKREKASQQDCGLLELKSTCKKLDLLEASLDSVLKEIQENLELNEDEMNNLTKHVKENIQAGPLDKAKKEQLIKRLQKKYRGKIVKPENEKQTRTALDKLILKQVELYQTEQQLNELVTLKAARNVGQMLVQKKSVEKVINNQEQTTKQTETKFSMNSEVNKTVETSIEELLTIEPRLGKNLFQDLLKLDGNSFIEAVELVNYQEKPLYEVLRNYESELKELRENCQEGKAYKEIYQIIGTNFNDALPILTSEKVDLENALAENEPTLKEVELKLESLKSQKNKLVYTENSLLEKKLYLTSKLKVLNQHVADHLMQEEKVEEVTETEERLCKVSKKIKNVQQQIINIDIKIYGRNNTEDLDRPEESNNLTDTIEKKGVLSEKLLQLREDLQKMAPYVNKNRSKTCGNNVLTEIPASEQVTDIIATRQELSRKLIDTENKIQEIITSTGYESSENEYSEQSQLTADPKFSVDVNKQSCKLSDKLLQIEIELNKIDDELLRQNISTSDIQGLKDSSEMLKKTLLEVEEELHTNISLSNYQKGKNKGLERVEQKIQRLKKRLTKNGVANFDYDEQVTETILKTKLKYENQLENIIERVTEDEEQKNVIKKSLKYLVHVRDETKKKILTLESDMEKMKKLNTVINGQDDLFEALIKIETSAMEKKTEGLSTMVMLAHDKLEKFLQSIQNSIREKMEVAMTEKKREKNTAKESLTFEEKQILSLELETITGDIQQSESELVAIEEFKTSGMISLHGNSLMKSLSEKKQELLSTLSTVHSVIESEAVVFDEMKLKKTLDEKITIKQELNELEERMDDQEHVLQIRLQKLKEIKLALENKLAKSITVEDFKQIITIFDEEEAQHRKTEGKTGISDLFVQRQCLIKRIQASQQNQNDDKTLLSKQISDLDDDITFRVNEILIQQDGIKLNDFYLYRLMSNKAPIIEIIRTVKDLQTTVTCPIAEDFKTKSTINNGSLKQIYTDLQQLEEMKSDLEYIQQRNLNVNDMTVLEELKTLNESKLDLLLKKIRMMNLFVERESYENENTKNIEKARHKKLTADRVEINKELDDVVHSYTSEVKENEMVLLSKPYVKEVPTKKTSLDFYLQDRDQKLSRLFIIQKHLENGLLSEDENLELQTEKIDLETLVEKIDESIIEGNFDGDGDMDKSARSFSPRSTSSRNSMTYVLDKRDQLIKKIYQLEQQETFLKGSEDMLNKKSTLEDVQERKKKLYNRLKDLEEQIHVGELSEDTIIGEIDDESKNTTIIVAYDHDIITSLTNLQKEIKSGKFDLPTDSGIVTDVKDILTDPMETDILEVVQTCNEQLREQKWKKKVKILEENKVNIEEQSDYNKLSKVVTVKQEMLSKITAKIELIHKKESLEKERENLAKKIKEVELQCDRTDDVIPDESKKKENIITKKDLKRSKVHLEKNLDEINVIISQYSNTIEKEMHVMEDSIKIDLKKKDALTESLKSLKSHKDDLEGRITVLNKTDCHLIDGEDDLVSLLAKRRDVQDDIEKTEQLLKKENIPERKRLLTEDLRKYYEEEKKYKAKRLRMKQKLKVIQENIQSMSSKLPKLNDKEDKNLRAQLGNDLFEMLNNKELNPKEKHLKTLFTCLEDRNVSEYIKELSTLCTVQSEQIENLKEEKTTIRQKQNEEFTQQISLLENELITVHEKLAEEENRKKSIKLKFGVNLYDLITEEKKLSLHSMEKQKFLDATDDLLKKEGTVENMLCKFYSNSQELSNKIMFLNQLSEDNKLLQERLQEKDYQLEMFKSKAEVLVAEYSSETESLRDDLREYEEKTCSLNEQAEKIKFDYEHAKEELNWVNGEYAKLKADFAEFANIKCLHENLQKEFGKLADKYRSLREQMDKASNLATKEQIVTSETFAAGVPSSNNSYVEDSENKTQITPELDSLRKKIKKLNKEKFSLQENLENETQKAQKLEDDVSTLKSKEKFSTHEMHKHCQVIERQERELKMFKESTSTMEKENCALQSTINDLKEKYQVLTLKYQNEATKSSKELRFVKNKVEEQRNEIDKINSENELVNIDNLKKVLQTENNTFKNEKLRLKEEIVRLQENHQKELEKLVEENQDLQRKYENITSEKQILLKKLNDLDESFETELTETRKDLNTRYTKSINKLNERISQLEDELLDVENRKECVEKDNKSLHEEQQNLKNKLQEQVMINETKEKTYQVKYSTLSAEIEGLKLENDELRDEVIELKRVVRKVKDMEEKEKELKEGRFKLQINAEQLQLERNQFEESVHDFMKTPLRDEGKENRRDDGFSQQLLKTTQEERDKISDELINTNKELLQTRNELRKLKSELREKEEEFADEERKLLTSYEKEQKNKIENIQQLHLLEKENLLKMYNDERNKWEDEMKILKQNLQEENIKKLCEQQNDFEKEFQKHLSQHLKENLEELDELRDQVDILKKQREELLNQFEEDKTSLTRKYEWERNALEETIRRLLGNLLKLKERRNRLRVSHEDEISELEERLESERDKLEERREEEIEALKTKLKKSSTSNIRDVKSVLRDTIENIITEASSSKLGIFRNKLDDLAKQLSKVQETGTYKFTLNDLKELVHMGGLEDILDCEYEAEQDMIKKGVREQYKAKLREETDALMKRLLELSDELESLRSYQ